MTKWSWAWLRDDYGVNDEVKGGSGAGTLVSKWVEGEVMTAVCRRENSGCLGSGGLMGKSAVVGRFLLESEWVEGTDPLESLCLCCAWRWLAVFVRQLGR